LAFQVFDLAVAFVVVVFHVNHLRFGRFLLALEFGVIAIVEPLVVALDGGRGTQK
jgi:hypothetical protein